MAVNEFLSAFVRKAKLENENAEPSVKPSNHAGLLNRVQWCTSLHTVLGTLVPRPENGRPSADSAAINAGKSSV